MARRLRVWTAVLGAVVLTACGWFAASRPQTSSTAHLAATTDYLPGVAADVYLPVSTTRSVPVVVLVPGGAWRTADRRGLAQLAEALSERGMFVTNATYRAADSHVTFPTPVDDIVCAIDFAVTQAGSHGYRAGPVVVIGHSAGAQLAALAALGTSHFRGSCPYPPATVDALVGLAGPYDVTAYQQLAQPLFGATPAAAPEAWRDGDPLLWVVRPDANRSLHVLLAHGSDDDMVMPTATEQFAKALEGARYAVTLEIVDGATHASIYHASVIADRITTWVGALP